jgi:N12 class adenine-specific DNA methylase
MELRRLGLARKPAIVVPNHMLEQFSNEFLEAYPNAKILAAGSNDLTGDKRRRFIARAATGDWDAVILTQGGVQGDRYVPRGAASLPGPRARRAARPDGEREGPRGAQSLTFKALQKRLENAEQKLNEKIAKVKDEGVTFEQTGIDYLMVDEAHHYKNLRSPSSDRSLSIEGSDRAIRPRHEAAPPAGARPSPAGWSRSPPRRRSATASSEAYTMQRFLRPDLLQDAGIDDFDSWVATFGEKVTRTEMSVDSGSFKQKSRVAKFRTPPNSCACSAPRRT